MDEKTEELRDIFTSVSDTDTVTEGQAETRGSLTDQGDVTERLADTVSTMRERYDFSTELDDDELCRLVEAFFDDATDAEIADRTDGSSDTVFRARMDLHLFRDDDTDAPFEMGALRDRPGDADPETVADELGVAPSTVRRYRRVLAARDEARCANYRFRNEFEELLGDGPLTTRLAEGVREDGLEEATEGMETDVSM